MAMHQSWITMSKLAEVLVMSSLVGLGHMPLFHESLTITPGALAIWARASFNLRVLTTPLAFASLAVAAAVSALNGHLLRQ